MKTPGTVITMVLFLLSFPFTAMGQVTPSENASRSMKAQTGPISNRFDPSNPGRQSGPALPPVLQEPPHPVPVRHLWNDLDRDGFKELFVLDQEGNLLFRNTGDGGFEEVTAMAFPEGAGKGGSGLFGDFNGDAFPDLFLFLEEGFVLFRNDGKLRFTDVTGILGLPADLKVARGQLEDYDNDGFGDLLVRTPAGDRIFRNRDGRSFGEVNVTGPRQGSGGRGPVPPVKSPGGAAGPGLGSSGGMTADTIFLNDNSPGSVGIGVPEVEGGDDATVQNDIVDGTVTGDDIQDSSVTSIDIANGTISSADIKNGTVTGTDIADESVTGADIEDSSLTGSDVKDESLTGKDIADQSVTGDDIQNGSLTGLDIANGSVDPGKVAGTAATLTGSQTFDKGTLHIDSVNHRVGIGTTSPSISSLHVDSDETYGCRVETSKTSGWAIYGRASATAGIADGVYGESESTSGKGLYGRAKAGTGTTYGVRGESESTTGRGVYGLASTATGINYGLKGHSSSTEGFGVYGSSLNTGVGGYSSSSSGTRYGVYGESASTSGHGVYGTATATTGTTYGVRGENASTSGRGVYGRATASTGTTYGIRGESSSTTGRGIFGWASASTGINYGIKGESASKDGRGVYGYTSASMGLTYGVRGEGASSSARAVSGYASSSSGITYGLYGSSASDSGRGVFGHAPHIGVEGHAGPPGIYNYGVYGYTPSSYGYGVYSAGDFGCSGTKSFVQPHPKDPSKEIRFVCLEGNESGTYFRGSSRLENGRAVIEVPEAFRLVTEQEGLTVQVTPSGPARLWFEEKSLERIVVLGEMDVEFDYFVNGVRRGFADHEPIRENHAWVPEYRDRPFGTQYPEALRMILVENGTLDPDFTPNKKTAAKMGWALRDYDKERLHDSDPKQQDITIPTADSNPKQETDRGERNSKIRRISSDPDLLHPEAMDRPEREKMKPSRENRLEKERKKPLPVDQANRGNARLNKDA